MSRPGMEDDAATASRPATGRAAPPLVRMLSPLAWLRGLVTAYSGPPRSPRRTTCPQCGRRLLGVAGPVVTASGRCVCGQRLGPPWVLEVGICGAVTAVLVGARTGLEVPAYLWFAALGVVLATVDVAARRLPNALTAAWAAGTLASLAVPAVVEHRGEQWLRAVAAGVLLTLLSGVLAVLRPSALGWGDVKAAAAVGAALGWLGWAAVYGGVLLAFLLASGHAVVLLVRRRADRRAQLALGPFLVAGALILIALLPGG